MLKGAEVRDGASATVRAVPKNHAPGKATVLSGPSAIMALLVSIKDHLPTPHLVIRRQACTADPVARRHFGDVGGTPSAVAPCGTIVSRTTTGSRRSPVGSTATLTTVSARRRVAWRAGSISAQGGRPRNTTASRLKVWLGSSFWISRRLRCLWRWCRGCGGRR